MSITICTKCKALVRDNSHRCIKDLPAGKQEGAQATHVDRGVEANPKKTLLEHEQQTPKDPETFPPKESWPGAKKPTPQSAVPKNTVRVRSANLLNAGS